MITLDFVNKEMATIVATDRNDLTVYQHNKLKKKMQLFSTMRNYLETDPSEEFIKSEKKRVQKIVDKITGGFALWQSGGNGPKGVDFKEQKTAYEKECNLKHYKNQLKALEFILT